MIIYRKVIGNEPVYQIFTIFQVLNPFLPGTVSFFESGSVAIFFIFWIQIRIHIKMKRIRNTAIVRRENKQR